MDAWIGELDAILRDPEFAAAIKAFVDKNCTAFEETEEYVGAHGRAGGASPLAPPF